MSKKAGIRRLMLEQIIRHGRITRNEAMEVAQTRLATIGEVVQTLLAEGIIEEPERVGRESTGRRASPLCFRGEYGYFLGIVLSPDCVKAVLLDNAGNLKAPMITGEVHENNPEAVFQSILDVLSKLRQQVGDAVWGTIRATGFADPGLVNEKTGTSIRAVNLPGWENIETAQRLKKILGGPVIMRPEMAARAYAERLLEGMVDDFGCFHLNLYDGVGGAYTRGLDVFVGDSFCQMEVGHVIVDEDGPLCHCGNHGCLEALVGKVGLTSRVEQLKQRSVDSPLIHQDYSSEHLVNSVRAGDKAAARIAMDAAQQIGKALSAATALLNPARISLSGPLFSLQDILLPVLRQTMTLRCLPQAVAGLDVRFSALGEEAPVLGAALIARHVFLLDVPDVPEQESNPADGDM